MTLYEKDKKRWCSHQLSGEWITNDEYQEHDKAPKLLKPTHMIMCTTIKVVKSLSDR